VTAAANKYYPFQVWASTLLFGSFLGIWLNFIRRPDSFDIGWALVSPIVLSLLGIFASLPAFGVYYLSFLLLHQRLKSTLLLKVLLGTLSIAGTLATLYFFGSKDMLSPTNRDGFLLTESYVFVVIFSGLIFRCYSRKPLPLT
jgi:hypothetical protein